MVLGLWNNYATWLMRFLFTSFTIDRWYLVSLVTHLNWTAFLENFLASSSPQQFHLKSGRNDQELKWIILWQSTTEYLKKPCVFTSCFNRANDSTSVSLVWWHRYRGYRGFWKQLPWRYWPKKLFNLTNWTPCPSAPVGIQYCAGN